MFYGSGRYFNFKFSLTFSLTKTCQATAAVHQLLQCFQHMVIDATGYGGPLHQALSTLRSTQFNARYAHRHGPSSAASFTPIEYNLAHTVSYTEYFRLWQLIRRAKKASGEASPLAAPSNFSRPARLHFSAPFRSILSHHTALRQP